MQISSPAKKLTVIKVESLKSYNLKVVVANCTILKEQPGNIKGDSALIDLFPKGNYNAVATDDAKLIRRLRTFEIPFILPGLIIFRFLKDGHINRIRAIQALNQLAEFISNDEFSTVR